MPSSPSASAEFAGPSKPCPAAAIPKPKSVRDSRSRSLSLSNWRLVVERDHDGEDVADVAGAHVRQEIAALAAIERTLIRHVERDGGRDCRAGHCEPLADRREGRDAEGLALGAGREAERERDDCEETRAHPYAPRPSFSRPSLAMIIASRAAFSVSISLRSALALRGDSFETMAAAVNSSITASCAEAASGRIPE